MNLSLWKSCKVGEYITTQKGFAFKSAWYRKEGQNIVKVSDFTDDSIDTSNLVQIPIEIACLYKKYSLSDGDIIIQTVGSWPNNPASVVGKCVRVPKEAIGALLNQNAVRIEPLLEIDKSFLFYLFRSDTFKDYIIGTAQGAANQASITLESIRGFEFLLPPLPTQRKIAAILSAYDDLIENNTRRVQVLEQMARALYREWFVEYRFPGHEQAEFVEDEGGRRPKGWTKTTLGQRARILMGQAPKSEFYNKTGDGLPFHQGVGTFGEHFPRHDTYCTDLGRVAKRGDILFSVRAPVGRTNIADRELVVGRGICAIRHFDEAQTFTLLQLNDRIQEDSVGNGAIFKAVTKADMHGIEWIEPPALLLSEFERHVSTLWAQIANLSQRNANLRRTRDLLLPRLVSGELDVSGLEIRGAGPEAEAEAQSGEGEA